MSVPSPAYHLELLSNIGVYQLLVPLRRHPPASVSSAPGSAPPRGWLPGLRLWEGAAAASRWAAAAAAARASSPALPSVPASLLELAFELPSAGRLRLALPLPSRVEASRAALSLPAAGDHISVRLPLFYSGAVSQRPARARTPVAKGEVAALRARGAELA